MTGQRYEQKHTKLHIRIASKSLVVLRLSHGETVPTWSIGHLTVSCQYHRTQTVSERFTAGVRFSVDRRAGSVPLIGNLKFSGTINILPTSDTASQRLNILHDYYEKLVLGKELQCLALSKLCFFTSSYLLCMWYSFYRRSRDEMK